MRVSQYFVDVNATLFKSLLSNLRLDLEDLKAVSVALSIIVILLAHSEIAGSLLFKCLLGCQMLENFNRFAAFDIKDIDQTKLHEIEVPHQVPCQPITAKQELRFGGRKPESVFVQGS